MYKKTTIWVLVSLICLGLFTSAGCQSDAGKGSLLGALAGAGVGQLAGGNTEASLIGAAIGAGAGYMLGNESDRKKTQDQMVSMNTNLNDQINSQIINVTNSNGSIVQVRLRRQGVGWVGTRGEYYPTLPTEDQLRPVYGF